MLVTNGKGQDLCELLLAEPWEERLATARRHVQVRESIKTVLETTDPPLISQAPAKQAHGIRYIAEHRLLNANPLREELISAITMVVVLCTILALNTRIVTSRSGFLVFVAMATASGVYLRYRIRKVEQFDALFGRKTSTTLSTARLWLAYTDTALQPLREALRGITPIRPSTDTGYRSEPLHPQLVLAQRDLDTLEARQRAELGILITLLETHDGSSHAVPYAIQDNDPRPSDQILRDALKLVESAERECCSSTSVRVADEQPPMPGAALYEHLRGTDKKKTA